MNFINHILIIITLVFFTACTKDTVRESVINEISLDAQVSEAYEEGLKSL